MNGGRRARRRCRRELLWAPLLAGLPLLACSGVESEPPAAGDGYFRVATWNIRFFPEPSTDVERTGQILAHLDADLVAVQEIADPVVLKQMLEQVNADLARQAEGRPEAPRRYAHELADSGGHGGQFVGYIYDESAVRLSEVETLTSLQMTADLRPGLFARVSSLRGGLDFQIIVMHTDSGTKDRDYQNRRRFLDALELELADRRSADGDIIVLGDLNTMGRVAEGGFPRVRWDEEISHLDESAVEMGLSRLPNSPACTEYYRGRGSFLDHILVSATMSEVPAETVARVFGYCARSNCERLDADRMPYDYAHVSDHCPVVVDLLDVDRD